MESHSCCESDSLSSCTKRDGFGFDVSALAETLACAVFAPGCQLPCVVCMMKIILIGRVRCISEDSVLALSDGEPLMLWIRFSFVLHKERRIWFWCISACWTLACAVFAPGCQLPCVVCMMKIILIGRVRCISEDSVLALSDGEPLMLWIRFSFVLHKERRIWFWCISAWWTLACAVFAPGCQLPCVVCMMKIILIGRVRCISEDSVLALSDGEPLMLWIRFSFVLHKERRIWFWCTSACWTLACAVFAPGCQLPCVVCMMKIILIGRVRCISEDSVLALSDGEPLMLWIRFSFVLHKERRIWFWCISACWNSGLCGICAWLPVALCGLYDENHFDRKSPMHQWRLCISSIWWRATHVVNPILFRLAQRETDLVLMYQRLLNSGLCGICSWLPVALCGLYDENHFDRKSPMHQWRLCISSIWWRATHVVNPILFRLAQRAKDLVLMYQRLLNSGLSVFAPGWRLPCVVCMMKIILIGRVRCISEDSVLALSDGEPLMLWIRFSFVLHKERRIWFWCKCCTSASHVKFAALESTVPAGLQFSATTEESFVGESCSLWCWSKHSMFGRCKRLISNSIYDNIWY